VSTSRRLGLTVRRSRSLIDSGEKYPYRFSEQQAITSRERLPCGDYAVQVGGNIAAVVERKTINDLISSMISGRMKFLLAELAAQPRAAVVVEEATARSSSIRTSLALLRPSDWPSSRRSFPQCRSCSAKLDRLPRNGPTAGLAPCQYELELEAGTSTLEENLRSATGTGLRLADPHAVETESH
jgi:hypothetical protein